MPALAGKVAMLSHERLMQKPTHVTTSNAVGRDAAILFSRPGNPAQKYSHKHCHSWLETLHFACGIMESCCAALHGSPGVTACDIAAL